MEDLHPNPYLLANEQWKLLPGAPEPWITRPFVPSDAPLILKAWASSYRTSPWAGTVPNNLFVATVAETIRQLFERGAVGTALEADGRLVGFIVTERTRLDEPVLHYLWIDPEHRGRRMGVHLMQAAGINPEGFFFFTHRTKFCAGKRFRAGRYEPAIARRKEA